MCASRITENQIAVLEKDLQKECVQALVAAEKAEPPHHSELFNDVYDVLPEALLVRNASLEWSI